MNHSMTRSCKYVLYMWLLFSRRGTSIRYPPYMTRYSRLRGISLALAYDHKHLGRNLHERQQNHPPQVHSTILNYRRLNLKFIIKNCWLYAIQLYNAESSIGSASKNFSSPTLRRVRKGFLPHAERWATSECCWDSYTSRGRPYNRGSTPAHLP
jgi:hypothetical protein